jgi:hypothetical protein
MNNENCMDLGILFKNILDTVDAPKVNFSALLARADLLKEAEAEAKERLMSRVAAFYLGFNEVSPGMPVLVRNDLPTLGEDVAALTEMRPFSIKDDERARVEQQIGKLEKALLRAYQQYANRERALASRSSLKNHEDERRFRRILKMIERVRVELNGILAELYHYVSLRFGMITPEVPIHLLEESEESHELELARQLVTGKKCPPMEVPHLQRIEYSMDEEVPDESVDRIRLADDAKNYRPGHPKADLETR